MTSPQRGGADAERWAEPDGFQFSRRTILASMLTLPGLAATTSRGMAAPTVEKGEDAMSADSRAPYFAYVGSRTTRERNARGDGISIYRIDGDSGVWTHVQLVETLANPSFLAMSKDGRHLYAVHGDLSDVSSFKRDDATGGLTALNTQSTQGKNPVHLALDATERFLVVANHITSSLAVLPVRDDGTLGEVVDLCTLKGKIGPHRVEQPFAKPHQIVFDPARKFMIVPDKGLDCIFTFSLDPTTGKLVPTMPDRMHAREGAGPRHAAFHPSGHYAYVVNELDSTVAAYRYDPNTGRLTPFQVLPALPDTFTGDSRAAEIAMSSDGKFVYLSNRGLDAISVFSVAPDIGRLTPIAWTPSGGKTPRFFAIDPSGRRLDVANEESDTISCFDRDLDTGKMKPTSEVIKTGSPVCILFREA